VRAGVRGRSAGLLSRHPEARGVGAWCGGGALLGLKDGTNNLDPNDRAAMARHVWVGDEGPAWMRGGT
jgi:deferrochelatase/peroxidase EfeB